MKSIGTDHEGAVQQRLCKAGEIGRAGEHAGMSGDATHEAGVFVIHFALDYAVTEGAIVLGGRNLRAQLSRRIEAGTRHAERAENVVEPYDSRVDAVILAVVRTEALADQLLPTVRVLRLRITRRKSNATRRGCDRPRARLFVAVFTTLAVALSIVQMIQYWLRIIPMWDTTWDQYVHLFLRFR